MNKIQKLHEALKDNPEAQRKLYEEAVRLVENKEADEQEALGRVVREQLDVDLTREELDALFAKVRELDPEQLEQTAGGNLDGAISWGSAGGSGGALAGFAIGSGVCMGLGSIIGLMAGGAIGLVGGTVVGFIFNDE